MRVGVIGATGAVGKELVEVLGKRRFPVTELKLFASARSAGLKQSTPWGEVVIEEYSDAAAGRLDLAFAVTTRADTEQLRCLPLTSEPMTVLCHPSHRLSTGGPVTPEELGGEPFVDFHPDWGPRRTTDAAFAAAGVHRTVALEVNDVHSLLDLVEEGLGIAVVPRHFAHKRRALPALPLKADTETPYETVAYSAPKPSSTSARGRTSAPSAFHWKCSASGARFGSASHSASTSGTRPKPAQVRSTPSARPGPLPVS